MTKKPTPQKPTLDPNRDALSLEDLEKVAGGASTGQKPEEPLTGGGLMAPVAVAVMMSPPVVDHTADVRASAAVAQADAALLASGHMDATHAIAHVEDFAKDHHISQIGAMTELLVQSHGDKDVAANLANQMNSGLLERDLANLVKTGQMTSDQAITELGKAVTALAQSSANNTALEVTQHMAANKATALFYTAAGDVGATDLQHQLLASHNFEIQTGLAQIRADHTADLVNSGQLTAANALSQLSDISVNAHVDRDVVYAELLAQTHGNADVLKAITDHIQSGSIAQEFAALDKGNYATDAQVLASINDVMGTVGRLTAGDRIGNLADQLAVDRVYAQLYAEASKGHNDHLQAYLNSAVNYELRAGQTDLAIEAMHGAPIGTLITNSMNEAMSHGLPKDFGLMELMYLTNGLPEVVNAAMGRFNSGSMIDDMAKFYVANGSMSAQQSVEALQGMVHALAWFNAGKVGGLQETAAFEKALAELHLDAANIAAQNPASAANMQALQSYISTTYPEQLAEGRVGYQLATEAAQLAQGRMTAQAFIDHAVAYSNNNQVPREVGLNYAVQLSNGNAAIMSALSTRLVSGNAETDIVNTFLKDGASMHTALTADRALGILTESINTLAEYQKYKTGATTFAPSALGMPPELARAFVIEKLYEAANASGAAGAAIAATLQQRFAAELTTGKDMVDYYTTQIVPMQSGQRGTSGLNSWAGSLWSHATDLKPEMQMSAQVTNDVNAVKDGRMTIEQAIAHVTETSGKYTGVPAEVGLRDMLYETKGNPAVAAALTAMLDDRTEMTRLMYDTGRVVSTISGSVDALAAFSADGLVGGLPPSLYKMKVEAFLFDVASSIPRGTGVGEQDFNAAQGTLMSTEIRDTGRSDIATGHLIANAVNEGKLVASGQMTAAQAIKDVEAQAAATQLSFRQYDDQMDAYYANQKARKPATLPGGLVSTDALLTAVLAGSNGNAAVAAELSDRLSNGKAETELAHMVDLKMIKPAQAVELSHSALTILEKFDPNHMVLGLPRALAESMVDFKMMTAAQAVGAEYIQDQRDWYHRQGWSDARIDTSMNYNVDGKPAAISAVFAQTAGQLQNYMASMPGHTQTSMASQIALGDTVAQLAVGGLDGKTLTELVNFVSAEMAKAPGSLTTAQLTADVEAQFGKRGLADAALSLAAAMSLDVNQTVRDNTVSALVTRLTNNTAENEVAQAVASNQMTQQAAAAIANAEVAAIAGKSQGHMTDAQVTAAGMALAATIRSGEAQRGLAEHVAAGVISAAEADRMVTVAVNALPQNALGGLPRALVLDQAELALYDAAGRAGDTALQKLLQDQHGFALFVAHAAQDYGNTGPYVNGLLSVQAQAEADAAKIAAGQATPAAMITHIISVAAAAHVPQEAALLALVQQTHGNKAVTDALNARLDNVSAQHDMADLIGQGYMTAQQGADILRASIADPVAENAAIAVLNVDVAVRADLKLVIAGTMTPTQLMNDIVAKAGTFGFAKDIGLAEAIALSGNANALVPAVPSQQLTGANPAEYARMVADRSAHVAAVNSLHDMAQHQLANRITNGGAATDLIYAATHGQYGLNNVINAELAMARAAEDGDAKLIQNIALARIDLACQAAKGPALALASTLESTKEGIERLLNGLGAVTMMESTRAQMNADLKMTQRLMADYTIMTSKPGDVTDAAVHADAAQRFFQDAWQFMTDHNSTARYFNGAVSDWGGMDPTKADSQRVLENWVRFGAEFAATGLPIPGLTKYVGNVQATIAGEVIGSVGIDLPEVVAANLPNRLADVAGMSEDGVVEVGGAGVFTAINIGSKVVLAILSQNAVSAAMHSNKVTGGVSDIVFATAAMVSNSCDLVSGMISGTIQISAMQAVHNIENTAQAMTDLMTGNWDSLAHNAEVLGRQIFAQMFGGGLDEYAAAGHDVGSIAVDLFSGKPQNLAGDAAALGNSVISLMKSNPYLTMAATQLSDYVAKMNLNKGVEVMEDFGQGYWEAERRIMSFFGI